MDTKRLFIKETVFNDCELFARWEVSADVIKFFSIDEGRTYEDVIVEYLKCKNNQGTLMFTIYLKDTGEAIGKIILDKISHIDDSLDIKRIYIADVNYRNKGYGEEALRAILEYAFINLHMERVTLDYFTGNKSAAYLYEKIGFKNEGIMRNSAKKNGKYYDLHLMSILRAEYYDRIHEK